MLRYRLDDLGWLQFEQLCQSLMKARLGLGIESWGGPTDLGRDAYYAGNVQLTQGIETRGPFVFQAKFVQGAKGEVSGRLGLCSDFGVLAGVCHVRS
jgi:hypothetical protein